jgi:hypothetical protein
MKSLSTKVMLASMLLTTLIGAETAHAYSNVVAGSHPEPNAQRIVRSATAVVVNGNRHGLSVGMPFIDLTVPETRMRLNRYRQAAAPQELHR